ncbi:hypothetical protein REPUB_Repub18cG0019000 [Reevesia pubescens]
MDGLPWSFDKYLFAMKDFSGNLRLEDYVLDKATFWVRMYGLPLKWLNSKSTEIIGKKIGEFKGVDSNMEKRGWGSFLRVWVVINQTKSLRRFVALSSRGRE